MGSVVFHLVAAHELEVPRVAFRPVKWWVQAAGDHRRGWPEQAEVPVGGRLGFLPGRGRMGRVHRESGFSEESGDWLSGGCWLASESDGSGVVAETRGDLFVDRPSVGSEKTSDPPNNFSVSSFDSVSVRTRAIGIFSQVNGLRAPGVSLEYPARVVPRRRIVVLGRPWIVVLGRSWALCQDKQGV